MSSPNNKGENEFYDDESYIVGKSEESEEENKQLSDKIKKEIRKNVDIITQHKKDK